MKTKTHHINGEDCTAPASWSDNAVYIWATKYARIVNGKKEKSVYDSVKRIAIAIYPDEKEERDQLEWEILNQRFAPNTPVWLNLGVNKNPICSACFILKVEDDTNSIINWWGTQTRIFKNGAGAGADLSNLREKNASTSGGGTASGPLSFAQVADSIGQVIRSGSIARRAATMLTMKDWHPDIEEFVNAKRKTEEIIRSINNEEIKSLNGDIYNYIFHQQANRAVRLSDKFMKAVEDDVNWELVSPHSNQVKKTIKAKDLLKQAATALWECGDPGIQFEDTIQRWHTLPATGPINSSNPCSEYMSIDNSACSLASINVLKFYDAENDAFDFYGLWQLVNLAIKSMDRIVSIASYPTKEIEQNTLRYRQLGLGIANLGGLLMVMGIPYDSEEGRLVAASLMALITGWGYCKSADLALNSLGTNERFPFRSYMCFESENAEATWDVITEHDCELTNLLGMISFICHPMYRLQLDEEGRICEKLLESPPKSERPFWQQFYDALLNVNTGLYKIYQEKRYIRNSQISVIAPTGTISFVMDCATTGCEPAFSLVYTKELAHDNTKLTVPLSTVKPALKKLGYSPHEVGSIIFRMMKTGSMKGLVKDEHLPIFATAVDPRGNSISPEGHIKMVAVLQPFVSGAISKTVNLPTNSSIQDIEKAILDSYKMGIKAITFYRDNSKATQAITTTDEHMCYNCNIPLIQSGTCWSCPHCGDGGICD